MKYKYFIKKTKEFQKARQIEEEALFEVAMCRDKNGEILTNTNRVLAKWKEHFEEHLNRIGVIKTNFSLFER
jgi:hypothetical protein